MLYDHQLNAPKLNILQIVIVKQGCKANAVLNALKGTIKRTIKSAVFFELHNSVLGRNVSRIELFFNNLIELQGQSLRCLNNAFIPARGVFRHSWRDVRGPQLQNMVWERHSCQCGHNFSPESILSITTWDRSGEQAGIVDVYRSVV